MKLATKSRKVSRWAGAEVQALRQFVGQSPWDTALVQEQLTIKLGELFPSLEAWLIGIRPGSGPRMIKGARG